MCNSLQEEKLNEKFEVGDQGNIEKAEENLMTAVEKC